MKKKERRKRQGENTSESKTESEWMAAAGISQGAHRKENESSDVADEDQFC